MNKEIRRVEEIIRGNGYHWVGNGFKVNQLLPAAVYGRDMRRYSPFLLMDYNAPTIFPGTENEVGVGAHPHRGFETVTFAFEGKVEHHDNRGNRGVIEPGDVQWMTAGAGIYLHYLSQEGFLVFTLDNRGSADRGEAFEQVIHRQCGQAEVRDQMVGIEYLKTLPYVDTERIGSDGWSYGGFMSTNLKIYHPETFKVSVAGGPVMDWKYYEIMYGERYMDTPEENPEGYELTSLVNKTDRLEGKLLIIHCTTDPVVVWQHSLSFIENCIHNGKQVDYFVYPGHDHNVYGPDRAHLIVKITEYFKNNL